MVQYDRSMKLTIMVKLELTEEQRRALLGMIERFSKAANRVVGKAFEHKAASKYKLEKRLYY
jgi:predicted transposase